MIDKDLQAVGLQEKEAKVYLAALELGKGTAQQIAIKAELKRPTTYVIMEELMRQGLVSSFYEGKKQYFVAENPERLADILQNQKQDVEKREEQLKSILPQLQSLNNRQAGKPVVKYYEGREGIMSMIKEHVKVSHGQTVYNVSSVDIAKNVFTKKENDEIIQDRIVNNMNARILYTSSEGDVADMPKTEAVRVRAEDFPVSCDISFFEDKVRIASLKNRLIGVVIEDKEIAKTLRSIFNLAWKYAKSEQNN